MHALNPILLVQDFIEALVLSTRACPPFPFFLMLMIISDSLQYHIDELDIERLDECDSERVVCLEFIILFEEGDAEYLEELLLDHVDKVRLEESDAREQHASYDS
jgi:hypothetical protein